VTTPKLILIGVLAVVLAGVLYLQFGRTGAAKPAATAASRVRPKTAAGKPAASRATNNEPAKLQTVRRKNGNLSRWQPPDLATVVQYDPFALPAAFPQPSSTAASEAIAQSDAASAEELAKEQAALAETKKQMQSELDALRHQGVVVLVKGRNEFVAVIGDQEIRVGDEINGFRVVSIDSDGVQLAWEPNR
jgi:hypothetical protein